LKLPCDPLPKLTVYPVADLVGLVLIVAVPTLLPSRYRVAV